MDLVLRRVHCKRVWELTTMMDGNGQVLRRGVKVAYITGEALHLC